MESRDISSRLRGDASKESQTTDPLVGQDPPRADAAEEKQCPFCAETIKAKAIKCRFCGELLPLKANATVQQQKENTTGELIAQHSRDASRTQPARHRALPFLLFVLVGLLVAVALQFMSMGDQHVNHIESSSTSPAQNDHNPTAVKLTKEKLLDACYAVKRGDWREAQSASEQAQSMADISGDPNLVEQVRSFRDKLQSSAGIPERF